MEKKLSSILLIIWATVLITLAAPLISEATVESSSETAEQMEEAGALSIQAVIPENQRDLSKTYFDLRMTPGQEQIIEVVLINNSDEEIIVEVETNDATTNSNGIVEYTKIEGNRDPSLKYGFSDIAETETEVVIAPHTSENASIKLKMPDEEFDGEILGGLYIKEKNQNSKASQNEDGSAVVNSFAYNIGVLLTENDNTVKPILNLKEVKAGQINLRNVIQANFQNPQATIITNLSFDVKVYRKGDEKPIIAQTSDGNRMAPNSNFDFGIDMKNQAFSAGTYILKGEATNGNEEWQFEKEFTITSDEAKDYNKIAVELEDTFPWFWIIAISILLFIALVVAIFLFRKVKRQNEQLQIMNGRKKKAIKRKKRKIS